MSMATLDAVARTAGVSKTTVSRVINQSTRVAPEVAQVVREAIEQTGYQPSARRRGPKTAGHKGVRTGNLLLLVIGSRASGYQAIRDYPLLLQGIEKAVHESGLKLVLASVDRDSTIPAALDANEVDGVLMFGPVRLLSPAALARLENLPAVGVLRGFEELQGRIDRVIYDNDAIGPMAAKYLVERNHQRLGFVNTDPTHPAFCARQRQFASAATAAGAQVTALVAPTRPENFRQEAAVYQSMVDSLIAEKVTGLFIAADYQAPQLYQTLEARGVMPGRDLDIIVCDNIPQWMDRLTPRPAAIDINLELVGYRGVQQLLSRLADPAQRNCMKVVIEPVLVPGDETA